MSAAPEAPGPGDPEPRPMAMAEFFEEAKRMLQEELQASWAAPDPDQQAAMEAAWTATIDCVFARLDELHPGAFEPERGSEDEGRSRRAAAPGSWDPQAFVHVQADGSMSEITVGMGSLAHVHFDLDEGSQALDMAGEMIRGESGCMEARGPDGRTRWAKIVGRQELLASPPTLLAADQRIQARFFGGLGDVDFFRN